MPIYESPDIIELIVSEEEIICASPENGGNEDVGYEDWNF